MGKEGQGRKKGRFDEVGWRKEKGRCGGDSIRAPLHLLLPCWLFCSPAGPGARSVSGFGNGYVEKQESFMPCPYHTP